MSLAPGVRLGPYEVVSAIGAGGMGEVYRARDTRLKRDVAIKILPDAFANDADRLARFQREAEVLATLNHPNIAQIYGLENRALVMELVEGATLADRIARGSIPIDDALAIARQIANALEAAHEGGIVHRDLKPANIKLTPDGKVKVLDFGLAKAMDEAHSRLQTSGGLSHLPTITSPAITMGGVILGTAAYMSPEQARGRPVDKRSDIWAFGCVLYKMITGHRAFDGEDVSETLAAIIKGEPNWSAIPPDTPVHVQQVLKHCLDKDRQSRMPDVSAARFLLQHAMPISSQHEETRPTGRSWIEILWKTAAILATVAAVALAARYRTSSERRDVVRFSISPPANTTFATVRDNATSVISPDGQALAFTSRDAAGKTQLWIRSLDSLDAVLLKGTENAERPFWSPDSRFIGFSAAGKLQKIPRAGGSAETVCAIPSGGSGRGGTWGASGDIVFNGGPQRLYRVSSSGGKPTLLVSSSSDLSDYSFPSFLPDGKHVLFFVESRSAQRAGIYITSLEGMEPRQLVTSDSSGVFAPRSRQLLFARNGTLYAQPFDLDRLSVSGEPSVVADRIEMSITPGLRSFSVSDNDSLSYTAGSGLGAKAGLQLTSIDRKGQTLGTIGPVGHYRGIDLSPDDTQIAAHLHDGDGGDVWIMEVATGAARRLTFNAVQDNSSPVWSPEGSKVAFASLRNGKWGIYSRPANGSVGEEQLVESVDPIAPVSWSQSGIAYVMADRNGEFDIWNFSPADRRSTPLVQDEGSAMMGQISPNGRWLAYRSSGQGGRNQILVTAFPPGGSKWQISPDYGSYPRWRRDGREIFFSTSATAGDVMAVAVNADSAGFEAGPPRALFKPRYSNLQHAPGYHPFAVSGDGARFFFPLMEAKKDDEGESRVVIVLNWSP